MMQSNLSFFLYSYKMHKNKAFDRPVKLKVLVHLHFQGGSTFPITVCTVPSSVDRTSRCNRLTRPDFMRHIN